MYYSSTQPARKACSISAESLLNLSGIHAQFRRFGCAISVAYAVQNEVYTREKHLSFNTKKQCAKKRTLLLICTPNAGHPVLGVFL